MIITMGRSILLRVDARSSDSYLGRDDVYFFQEKYLKLFRLKFIFSR